MSLKDELCVWCATGANKYLFSMEAWPQSSISQPRGFGR